MLFQFDATTVAPDTGAVAPIPAGVYLAQVVESSVAALKSGNGTGLTVVWQVIEGPSKGRKVWQSFNVKHNSAEAQRIGQAQFSALCHAVGRVRIGDTAELHGVPCRIKVAIRKDDQYGDKNEVKGVESAIGSQPAQATPFPPSAPAAAPQAPAAAPAAPWARRAA